MSKQKVYIIKLTGIPKTVHDKEKLMTMVDGILEKDPEGIIHAVYNGKLLSKFYIEKAEQTETGGSGGGG